MDKFYFKPRRILKESFFYYYFFLNFNGKEHAKLKQLFQQSGRGGGGRERIITEILQSDLVVLNFCHFVDGQSNTCEYESQNCKQINESGEGNFITVKSNRRNHC